MSTSPYYNKIQVDIKVNNLEQQISNIADGTSGMAYPDLSTAMSVTPLPNDGIIFTIDEVNETEAGVYAYDSGEVSGYRFVRTLLSDFLKEEDVFFKTHNLYDDSTIDETMYITGNGYVSDSPTNYGSIGFTPIEAEVEYTFSGIKSYGSSSNVFYCFYDSNKTPLTTRQNASNIVFTDEDGDKAFTTTSPSNAAFVNITLFRPSTNIKLQIVRGNELKPYLPFRVFRPDYSIIQNQTIVNDTPVMAGAYYGDYRRKKYFYNSYLATKEYIPVIIVAGQSNTDGRAPISSAPEWITNNDNKIDNALMWNRMSNSLQEYQLGVNSGAENNTSTSFAYDLFLYKKLLEIYPQIVIIKCSLGGSPISPEVANRNGYWTPDFQSIPEGKRKLLLELTNRYNSCVNYSKDVGFNLLPIAIIWHQGETDNAVTQAALDYEENLKDVVAYIRGITNNPVLPFIFGTIPNSSTSYNSTIRTAQLTVSGEDEFSRLVIIDDVEMLPDGLHFPASTNKLLGEEMFDKLLQMGILITE